MSGKLQFFIPLVVAITLIFGTIYATVQQVYRQGANDPQIQMAEDAANELINGANPTDLNSLGKVDVSKNLSSFYIVFDKNGKEVASNVTLNGKTPVPPPGVFDSFKGGSHDIVSIKKSLENKLIENSDENRFTWQPDKNVRIAAVLLPYNNGFVLAGRSLREIEMREDRLVKTLTIAYVVTIGFTLFFFILPDKTWKKFKF